MVKPILPAAFITASASAKKEKPVKTEARINMSADVAGAGLCPECHKPMELSHANGHAVLTCDEHRIAIPVPDKKGE
jgi:hypothetical protein